MPRESGCLAGAEWLAHVAHTRKNLYTGFVANAIPGLELTRPVPAP